MTLIDLEAGDMRATVAPALGGSLTALSWRGHEVLRSAKGEDLACRRMLAMACFPMAPWVNRIAGGRFQFGGRRVRPRRPLRAFQLPIHGQAWMRAWRVSAQEADRVELSLLAGGDDWPWRYRLSQIIALTPDYARITLQLRNEAPSAMPSAIGLHPYFPITQSTRIAFRAPRWWRRSGELPQARSAPPGPVRFPIPRAPKGLIDTCYLDWDGAATVHQSGLRVRLSADGARFLHLYAARGARALCLEPQTAMPDAVHHLHAGRDCGLVALAPGRTLSLTLTLRPEPSDAAP